MRKNLAPEEVKRGFDTTVTHRDPQTGLVTHTDPYILRVVGEGTEKQKLWERPKGSGNLWDSHGNAIGRWIYEEKIVRGKKIRTGKYMPEEAHIVFTAPLTKDQLLAKSLSEKDVKIAELERELKAIQMEKDRKAASPAQPAHKKDQGS